ncbi:putative ribonuclease H-like domain-containing protein [Tanacetum coccineum]
MYNFYLKNVVPSGDLTCLFAKATIDESKLWHRRLGHVNFKTMNKLVKGNLVRGLPSKIFENDHTCVACQKGKQHKASCKAKLVSFISQPLQMLHMDLFGPTSVRSINHKTYCLVVTDDFSRFSWVFFLASKDETSGILKRFITEIENQLNHKVKVISKNEKALKNVLDKMMDQEKEAKEQSDTVRKEFEAQCNRQNLSGKTTRASSSNSFNTVSTLVNAASAPRTSNDVGPSFVPLGGSFPDDPLMPDLEDTVERLISTTWNLQLLYLKPLMIEKLGLKANARGAASVQDLEVKQQEDGIFISQDKYVGEILKKFDFFSISSASTPLETHKALTKDKDVCACSRFQVQPKVSHLNAVKRIFRYLKGQPKLGLWYLKDSPLILEAFQDSDNAGASLDRKSTTGGCQFLSSRLISWQCKKQTVVANSTTEAEYIAASHYCGQVFWIQNQMVAVIEAVYKELGDRMERAATIASSFEVEQDSEIKTVTEASIRRHLKLEDSSGINSLPNAEIFKQLALMGTSNRYTGVDTALFPTMLVRGQTLQGEGSTIPVDSQNTPIVAPSNLQPTSTTPITTPKTSPSKITSSPSLSSPIQQSLPSMHTTHDAEEPATMPHDSPLQRVQSLGRDDGSMTLSELTVLCTNLSNKVTSLEAKLAQTKQTYGTALTKLIKKVKKLEQTVKSTQARRRLGIVVSNDEEGLKDPSKPGGITEIDQGPSISLKRKDKGKAIMEEDESVQKKTKKQLEQERLGHEEAIRLAAPQEQIDEEERQRIARDEK